MELESEIIAKEQSARGLAQLPPECDLLLLDLEKEIGMGLGHPAPADWKGWLTYRRGKQALIACRGRSFKVGIFAKWRAGLDVAYGLDTITEHERGFDVSPPQDLDHLLINFGAAGESTRVFLWYGENLAPYKLIFAAQMAQDPEKELKEAIVEACVWILTRPKQQALLEFLKARSGNVDLRKKLSEED